MPGSKITRGGVIRSGNDKNLSRVRAFDFGSGTEAGDVHLAGVGGIRADDATGLPGHCGAFRKLSWGRLRGHAAG